MNNENLTTEIKSWIENFCLGNTTVSVGHLMGTFNEGINTQTLEEVMASIRNNKHVAEFIKQNDNGLNIITNEVVINITKFIQAKFATAKYYGD
jgi:hypothetical protein